MTTTHNYRNLIHTENPGINIQDQVIALEETSMKELKQLVTPSEMLFTCSLCHGLLEHSPGKKRKHSSSTSTPGDVETETGYYIELEWLCGDDRDNLHQILQYLNNQLPR